MVARALEAGYRTSTPRRPTSNEAGVGPAVRATGSGSRRGLRDHQVSNADHGYEQAQRAFDASPGGWAWSRGPLPDPLAGARHDRYVETWKALVELPRGRPGARDRVSNFQPAAPRAADRRDRHRARRQPGRAAPALPAAGLRASTPSSGSSPRRGARWRRGGRSDPTIARIAERARQDPGSGGDPLAPAARQHRHPEVGHPRADRGELRRLRLRARARDGRDRALDARRPHGPGPGHLHPGPRLALR